jgi:hypothetical protein
MAPSLDGRRFASDAAVEGGDVGVQTLFRYRERDGIVGATYAGGAIVEGHLVGTRVGDALDFRYVQLRADGTTASGRCRSVVEVGSDGRLVLHETWAWESEPGSGTSVMHEVVDVHRAER